MNDGNIAEGPVVFITHIPERKTPDGARFPSVNVTPAVEFGEIRVMMPSEIGFVETTGLVEQMRERLKDYSFFRGDSVLPLGDPVMMVLLGSLLTEVTDAYHVLRWDRRMARYVKIAVAV